MRLGDLDVAIMMLERTKAECDNYADRKCCDMAINAIKIVPELELVIRPIDEKYRDKEYVGVRKEKLDGSNK